MPRARSFLQVRRAGTRYLMDTLTLTLTPTLTLTLTQVRRAGLRYLMDTSCKKHPSHAAFVDVEPRAGTLVVFRRVQHV